MATKMMRIQLLVILAPICLLSMLVWAQDWPAAPMGKATDITRAHNAKFGATLALDHPADFEAAKRGLVAQAPEPLILNPDGSVAWDLSAYQFIAGEAPETVNPSLWRQAQLNALHGLYEVVDGIWQIRGYDLAVMTVIRRETSSQSSAQQSV